MKKLIIAGSRGFNNYPKLERRVRKFLNTWQPGIHSDDITIISGTARGADQLGERYALENGMGLIRMPAEWSRYGKSAGYKRNVQMAEQADALLAFWDGQSRGTKHMIDIANEKGLYVGISYERRLA